MKIKLLSLVLVLSFLISLFTTYSFAQDTEKADTKGNYTSLRVHYKNSFGDDADDVGGDRPLNNAVNSFVEKKQESNGNKYGYYVFDDSGNNVFMEFNPSETTNIGPDMLGYMIFEFDFNDFGSAVTTSKFLDVNSGKGSFGADGRVAASDILNVANDSRGNYFYLDGNKSQKIYIESNEWVHVRCEFSVLSTSATKYQLKCYIGDEYFESSYTYGNPKILYQIRLGSTKSTNQRFGLDNIVIYTTPDNTVSAPNGGILGMKVGAENARYNSGTVELEHVPMLINDEIYCPVDIIERFSGNECLSEYVVLIDNAEYVRVDNVHAALDIPAKAYDMGLVLIGNYANYLGDDPSYAEIAAFMKTFVFDIPAEDQLISDVASNTNGFDHPYLLVDGDRFAELKSIYTRGSSGKLTNSEDLLLYSYIKGYIASAASTYKTYCGTEVSATYLGILDAKVPINGNYSKYNNNGYDNGGRVSIDTKPLIYFAFAYQITGNMNYARAAYDFMIYLGNWNHWGPDHFLNCADTAYPFAIAYDWLYDAFVKLNKDGEKAKSDSEIYDKSKLATILFTHVIIPGYVQSNNLTCPWPGTANSRYSTKTSNWNAVCTSGVVMAALMLLNEDVSTAGMVFNTQTKSGLTFTEKTTPIESIGKSSIHTGLSTYSDYAAKLVSMNLGTLAKYGLDQYYPDGSYIESPGYWSYGTNSLFRLLASLLSATGDDYGFMDAWGIDTTCYFAIHSESSDYKMWNFNDGSDGVQDSSLFFFVGSYYEDDNLVRVRKKQLANGKSYAIYDILFYNTSITGEPELTTEYEMVGIDAFSVRSSWDKGAIYAGIIGGPNTVSHGQMDAGSFIYHNNGKVWFTDLGTDNYNMYGGYFSNFKLYRVGGEGHNMLLLSSEQSSLPYGQSTTADPKIIKSASGDNGGYAILDMSDAYGSHVLSGQRGMLFTNSRNTVVIQDEYVFNGAKTVYWFGHYQLATGYVDDVVISADGRTAFMISGDDILRVSIVSNNTDLKFEIMDTYTYVLDVTKRTDRDKMGLADTEYNRDAYRKLAIKCENVSTLNLAVVIEEVSGYEIGSSYKYTYMNNWSLDSDESEIIQHKFVADFEERTAMIGSYLLSGQSDSFSVGRYNTSDNSYLAVLSNASASPTSGAFTLRFKDNKALRLRDFKYVTFDADVYTDSLFIHGSVLGVNVQTFAGETVFVPLVNLVDNKIIANGATATTDNSFVHLTVIIDTSDGTAYVYVNDALLAKINGAVNGYESISNVEIALAASSELSSIMLDNLYVRTFAKGYDGALLSSVLENNSSLCLWDDRITYKEIKIPLALANGNTLYNCTEIENAILDGHNVELLKDVHGTVRVNAPVSVNTNGFKFSYVSSTYIAKVNGNNVCFAIGDVIVTWHIGGITYVEAYNSSSVATFKGQSAEVGKLTYTKNETSRGVVYKFFTTGWAKAPGGASLSSADMVVSSENCEFWLVNNLPIECLFATVDAAGNVTRYNTESDLRNKITSEGSYDIVLCKDIELTSASTIAIPLGGKNLYLNGHKLSSKQNDAHVFIYRRDTKANFNIIGPGTVETVGVRSLFTSDSSTSDVTSAYGIVSRNVNYITNTQLADLRIGQHKFINCSINQHSASKAMFALWNKNPYFSDSSTPNNLLSVTFDGCTVSSSASLISYSGGTYSEVYLNNTAVSVKTYLFESSAAMIKFNVSGNSSIISPKIANDMTKRYSKLLFERGVRSNIEIANTYLKTGTMTTNSYDTTFPYLISDKYAIVTWKDASGNVLLNEYVALGVTPKLTNPIICEYLRNAGAGYTYNLSEITSTVSITLTPILKGSAPIMMSMTIENDLKMHLYIEKTEMDGKIALVTVDGIRLMSNAYELVTIDGVTYYKHDVLSFAPAKASRRIDIVVKYLDGSMKNTSVSAVDYLEELLAISETDDERVLIVKLLKYIHSAQTYFGSTSAGELDRIRGIIDTYKEYDIIFGDLKAENVATGILRDAIASVSFNLSAAVRIKLYLNSGYTGQILTRIDGVVTEYDVKNGMHNGKRYIEVVLPASKINSEIALSDGVDVVRYGLNAYYGSLNNTDTNLNNLLFCLSEYSSAAKRYIED